MNFFVAIINVELFKVIFINQLEAKKIENAQVFTTICKVFDLQEIKWMVKVNESFKKKLTFNESLIRLTTKVKSRLYSVLQSALLISAAFIASNSDPFSNCSHDEPDFVRQFIKICSSISKRCAMSWISFFFK